MDGTQKDWYFSRSIQSRERAQTIIDELAEQGVDCLKLYNNLSVAEVQWIKEAAAKHALPIIGHAPWDVPLPYLGQTEVQHLMGMVGDWSWLSPRQRELSIQISVDNQISHTPTMVAFDFASRLNQHKTLVQEPAARLMPRMYTELLWSPAANPHYLSLLGAIEELQGRVPEMQQAVKALHDAGVPILVGTDTPNPFVVPGASVHRELELLVEAGFSHEEAWAAASRGAGEALRQPGLGTFWLNAPADVLLFRKDPLQDLTALSSLEAVIVQGRLYRKAELDAALARYQQHFGEGGLYDRLTVPLVRAALEKLNRDPIL